MEISSKLAGLAKRHASVLTGELEQLVRAIGEAKSKSEEDAIVQRMVHISKQQIKEGLPRKGDNTKALKDLLVYLIYINMLGHDTSWADAAVIQLCSHKSLVVKKVRICSCSHNLTRFQFDHNSIPRSPLITFKFSQAAYLATSLLIDPSSELTIMVTATIQADLRSDNFLVVCTALQAISRCTGTELVSVFLPQVLSALRHDKDHVKKKALLALHRLLQLDPNIAQDVERPLIDKLGYKEPSVMVAALCGLHELARANPAPYRNLVHYFTNILKQAAEGKLGRGWDYHRAPAPFVQLELLRLLALLGAGDQEVSSNMYSIIVDVWRRADTLASTVGNSLMLECVRTATAIYPSDTLLSMAMQSAQRFLQAKDSNLRYAGIDILTRLVAGDSGRVEQYQLAIVECLRSPDVTLKRKTLDLLFKMAGPGNMEVVADEVLSYLREGGDDEGPRQQAAAQLVTAAEQFAPSRQWFCTTMIFLLENGSDVAPRSALDSLLRVVGEGGPEGVALRRSVAHRCLVLLDRPKLPAVLLRVACWVLGEYGLLFDQPFEIVIDKLVGVLETQAPDTGVQVAVAGALGKLSVRAGKPLSADAKAVLDTFSRSECLAVQQVAVEMAALCRAPSATQQAALPSNGNISAPVTSIDPGLPFLNAYVAAAESSGAPPYLSLEDRVAMGVTRNPNTFFPSMGHPGALKFEAYELAQPAVHGAPAVAVSGIAGGGGGATQAPSPAAPAGGSLFDGLDLGGIVISEPQHAQQQPQQAAGSYSTTPPMQPVEQELRVNKAGGRRWGPHAAQQPAPSPTAAVSAGLPSSSTYQQSGASRPSPQATPTSRQQIQEEPTPVLDAAQQKLAASLFGGRSGRTGQSAGVGISTKGGQKESAPKTPEVDLLGDILGMDVAAPNVETTRPGIVDTDALFGLETALPAASSAGSQAVQGGNSSNTRASAPAPSDPMAALAGLDIMSEYMAAPPAAPGGGALDLDFLGGLGSAPVPAASRSKVVPRGPPPSQDPFANLFG